MVKFAYAVGRVRALEAHLLDEGHIIRMVDAKDFESAYLVLREAQPYAEKTEHSGPGFEFESLLEKEWQAVKELLEKLAPGNEFLAVLFKKYEPALPFCAYLKMLQQTAAKHNLPLFTKYALGFITLNQLKLDLLEGQLTAEAAQTKFRYTDFHKAVKAGLEYYQKTGSLLALERETDNYLTGVIKRAKYMAFGIEPLIGFFIAKESEIKIVRLILTAKVMHIKTEEIKERLRLSYV